MTCAMVCASKQFGVPVMSVHVKKFRAAWGILSDCDPTRRGSGCIEGVAPEAHCRTSPLGALEDDIVWMIARLVRRKEHLATLRIGELALEHESRIQAQKSRPDGLLEMREARMQAADDQARKDLGAN